MLKKEKQREIEPYNGFEQGPIRPPSESASLLLRVTRNCPWNHCTFCGIYRERKFSLRPVEHIVKDIDLIHENVNGIQRSLEDAQRQGNASFNPFPGNLDAKKEQAFYAAYNWIKNGMESIFLQDSNSLIIKPDNLVHILMHIKKRFPDVKRITSYARSHTIARIKDADLERFARAGLNRIHIGMESGSDKVLAFVKKGVDKATHVIAGQKVKNAGIELSEYIMPGLGGRAFTRDHALESADALNQINPDFIRLRTLAVPRSVPLYQELSAGTFQKMGDMETAREILMFLEHLDGITSTVKSDHILNLFEEVEGVLPEDKSKMTDVVNRFLHMPPRDQMLYQVGRRMGIFSRLDDLGEHGRRTLVERRCMEIGVTPENVDHVMDIIMHQFI
ncbi:MAG: radical SAM protein [Desulfamplus sp.]|nr:radical SAM protein [Desulfamplus sp.]